MYHTEDNKHTKYTFADLQILDDRRSLGTEVTPPNPANRPPRDQIGTQTRDPKPSLNPCPDQDSSFGQLQAHLLVQHPQIHWVQLVYFDPSLDRHHILCSQASPLPKQIPPFLTLSLAQYPWLTDFPPALQVICQPLPTFLDQVQVGPNPVSRQDVGDSQQKWEADYYVVICPIGYHDYQPEYILALTQGALSTTDQTWLIDQAKLLSQHLQLCQAYQLKTTEIHCLEQVLHRVGHQLKNPLALVGLYAENLYRSLAQTSLRQQADLIRTTVQNLADHLTDLLYCSRAGQLQRSRQDLRQLIRASVVDLDFWIREKHLHISYPQEALWGWVDPLQIKQVFDNLLSNAVHFSPFQGIIDLQWHCFQQEILIQIQDQGPGLPAEDCQKIFKPFYSQREGGTGLGLTIARKVMLDHHGNLWAENLPQGGAQFSLVLPDRCPTGFMQD